MPGEDVIFSQPPSNNNYTDYPDLDIAAIQSGPAELILAQFSFLLLNSSTAQIDGAAGSK